MAVPGAGFGGSCRCSPPQIRDATVDGAVALEELALRRLGLSTQAATPAIGSGLAFLQVDGVPPRANETGGCVVVGDPDGDCVRGCSGVNECDLAVRDRESGVAVVVNADVVVDAQSIPVGADHFGPSGRESPSSTGMC